MDFPIHPSSRQCTDTILPSFWWSTDTIHFSPFNVIIRYKEPLQYKVKVVDNFAPDMSNMMLIIDSENM